MRLRYAGPGPHDDEGLGLVRPGDVYDFSETPDWGPWEPVDDGAEKPAEAPGTPAPAGGGESQPADSTPPAAASSTGQPEAGM